MYTGCAVLLCFVVCLTLLVPFFLFISLTCIYMDIHIHCNMYSELTQAIKGMGTASVEVSAVYNMYVYHMGSEGRRVWSPFEGFLALYRTAQRWTPAWDAAHHHTSHITHHTSHITHHTGYIINRLIKLRVVFTALPIN